MVSPEKDRVPDLTASLGVWLLAFREGSWTAGELASANFYVWTPYSVDGFGESVVSFASVGLRDIRRKPELYWAPLGGPSLKKGAEENNFFGTITVTFTNFSLAKLDGEQPACGVAFKILPDELFSSPEQEEWVFNGVPSVFRNPNGTVHVKFDRVNIAGQDKILILPFRRNDKGSLTRLLFGLGVKFEELAIV